MIRLNFTNNRWQIKEGNKVLFETPDMDRAQESFEKFASKYSHPKIVVYFNPSELLGKSTQPKTVGVKEEYFDKDCTYNVLGESVIKKLSEYYNIPIIRYEQVITKAIEELSEFTQELLDLSRIENIEKIDSIINMAMYILLNKYEGWILVNYPKTLEQSICINPDIVVLFPYDEEGAIDWHSGYQWCPVCMRLYHSVSYPSTEKGVCDRDQTKLIVRDEDKAPVIRKKFTEWRKSVEDIIQNYRTQNKIIELTQDGIDDASTKIFRYLEGKYEMPRYPTGLKEKLV